MKYFTSISLSFVILSFGGCGDSKGILRGDNCEAPGLEWMEAVEGYDKQEVIDLATKFEAAAKADAELLKLISDSSSIFSLSASLREIVHNTSGRTVKVSQSFYEKANTYRASICNIERWLKSGTLTDSIVRVRAQLMLLSLSESFSAIASNEGNVTNIVSINQQGGITAHSVNVNQAIEPEWSIGTSEKISDNGWRAKLTVRGRGSMAYYNWNILLSLNTPVIKREDVPGEVTVGPWMPLNVAGGQLGSNQFFIGFSEFKPDQGFSIYLYTKEPLTVQRVDVISDKK